MKKILCFETTICWRIALEQTGRNRFIVTYGAETHTGLSYEEASAKLGSSIMHALACEGRLDNRLPGEH